MEHRYLVQTGEFAEFEYELAGLGSRFLALTLDTMIQFLIVGTCIFLLAMLAQAPHTHVVHHHAPKLKGSTAMGLGIMIITIFLFLIFYGYFIIFGCLWHGQTPGKRALNIRVVRDKGYPVDFLCILIRELVRIIESLLGFYLISSIVMLISKENKRLGDYSAGTIVIRERLHGPLSKQDQQTA